MWFSKIYYAGGSAVQDISAQDLAQDLEQKQVQAYYIADREACFAAMLQEAKPGDTLLLMGARDPSLAGFTQKAWLQLQMGLPLTPGA